MSLSKVCTICQNLGRCDKTIAWDSLQQSADYGCAACKILQDGICSLKEDDIDLLKIDLVVDMSLFVYTYNRDVKLLEIFEFFTLPGMTRWHLDWEPSETWLTYKQGAQSSGP